MVSPGDVCLSHQAQIWWFESIQTLWYLILLRTKFFDTAVFTMNQEWLIFTQLLNEKSWPIMVIVTVSPTKLVQKRPRSAVTACKLDVQLNLDSKSSFQCFNRQPCSTTSQKSTDFRFQIVMRECLSFSHHLQRADEIPNILESSRTLTGGAARFWLCLPDFGRSRWSRGQSFRAVKPPDHRFALTDFSPR